jgi:hypothetical protein
MAATDLAVALEELFSKYENESLSEVARKLDSDFEQNKHQFELTRYYVRECIKDGDFDTLKANIDNKLAVGRQRIHPSVWWWAPVPWRLRDLLEKVQKTVEKFTEPKPWRGRRWLRYGWKVLVEIFYLGIVIGIFAAATSKFEKLVFAILIMIYSQLSGIGLLVRTGTMMLGYQHEEAYGEIGRALRLGVPISRTSAAAKELSKTTVETFIHLVSISIGSIIALGYIVVLILK